MVAGTQEQRAAGRRVWTRTAKARSSLLELILVALLYVVYTSSRLLASNDLSAAKSRARTLMHIEHATGLNWEHALNVWFIHHGTIALLGCYFYSTAHYIVTPAALAWLYFRGRDAYLPARRALVVGTLIALALYLMLPTAPPRFMGYADILSLHSSQGWWGADASAPKGMGQLTNQLAAFPSLHAGWSLWVAIFVTRATRNPVLRGLAWADALITALVVIGTGNHWVLDVIVGWLVIIAGTVSVLSFDTGPRTPAQPPRSV